MHSLRRLHDGLQRGAKKSLDTNLLLQAWQRGAEICTGASVTSLVHRPDPDGDRESDRWELVVVHTNEALRRRNDPLRVTAGKVILAAGTWAVRKS